MIARVLLALMGILATALPSFATTYYVNVATGNDTTGTGAIGAPWKNPQKCVASGSPLVAGDTCEVADGTYTDYTAGTGVSRVMIISTSSPVATAAQPITIKAANRHGATIVVPDGCSVSVCSYYGIYIASRSYYIIDGFQFTREGSSFGSTSGILAIYAQDTTGIVIRNNHFHDIARNVCGNSTIGNAAVYMGSPVDALLESNQINTVGRLRNGEAGCSTNIFHHDHGFYINAATNITIKNNICYDTNRGFCVNLKANVGVKTYKAFIYHNLFADASPTDSPGGMLGMTNQLDDVRVKNNIFYQPTIGNFIWTVDPGSSISTVPVGAGIIIEYNLTDANKTNSTVVKNQALFSPITSANNTFNATPGFTNAASRDYTLTSASVARDVGTNLGYAYNGAAPDIGPFEVPIFSACEVRNGEASKVRVTFTNNDKAPMLPASSVSGVTFRKAGASNAVVSSARVGDNQYDFTVTNAFAGGDAVDMSIVPASTNLTNYANIGGQSNQAFVTTLTNQACTNNVSAPSAAVFTGTKFRIHGLYGDESAPEIKAATNTNYKVIIGGAHRIRVKIGVTVADPVPKAFALCVSYNGGAYTRLTDSYVNHVKMYGVSNSRIPAGQATTEQLASDYATDIVGLVVSSATAVPDMDFSTNSEGEIEFAVGYETTAVADDTYDYRPCENDGTALTAHTNTARVTMKRLEANGGN